MRHHVFQHMALGFVLLAGALASAFTSAEFRKLDVAGIRDFTQLENIDTFAGEQAGFGGATEPAAMGWLRDQGFVTVINLRVAEEDNATMEQSRQSAQDAGLNFVNIPLDPNSPAPGFMDAVLKTASDASMQPVYIHCNSGTRAAAVWMIARVTADGLAPIEAEQEARLIAEKPEDALAFFNAYIAGQDR